MSFTFSRALVEAYSRATCSAGDASAPSSSTPTPDQSWWPGKTTEHSRLSRFGMTCAASAESRGEELLMWWLGASPARTSLSPARETGWMGSDQDSGRKWRASFTKYDPAESKWRTPQCSLLGGLAEFSETWPTSGLMRNGECWERTTAALPTVASESGSWAWRLGLTQKPTHNVPTPTASDHIERKSTSKEVLNPDTNKTVSLDRWVKFWPTPSACMSKGSSPAALTRKSGQSRANDRLDHAVMASDRGQLNPSWVEWLMGWPIGWTDLKPLATAKFREWQQQHGAFSAADERKAA